jgi:hypothetical protein
MPESSMAELPLAPSSSDSSIVTTLGVPMPTPGTPTAPYFKGKRVEDFLDSLEQHADSARVAHTQLPGYVLRYCHTKVRIVIEGSAVWAGDDWVKARTFLADLYISNDAIPVNSPDRLRQWSLKHGESGMMLSRRDVDKYYREFTALSSGLAPSRMLETEVSLCFYRGIPTTLRIKIKKRIPAANLKTSSPPSIASLLGWLRAEFDEEDLDAKIGPVSLDLDSDSDSSSSESDDDLDKTPVVKKRKKKPTKKVTFEKTVPAAPITEPKDFNTVDRLTKQMEDLRLAHAEFLRSVNITPNTNLTNQQVMREARCFFCDKTTHRLGLKFCPEVEVCIKEGLVAYTPLGRLARPDGSELPRAFGSDGGVAKVLREQQAASSHLKGKGREATRDLPPHMAHYAGLLFDGQEVLESEVFNGSSFSNPAFARDRTLSERFYWPNMYDQIAYFVRSCNICQLRSRTRPIVPFSPTWNSGILRRFDLDTIHMPDGVGGMKYLLQATDPAMSWVEARAARKPNSETWAKFLYEEVYSRFGCVLLCLVDGGSEFKGAVDILFKQYGIVVIVSSPYHPEGNGHAERSHQTLVNSILRACGKDAHRWPLYVHAGLWAMRCSTSRVTGYTPYFLLYGLRPCFAFDFADRTWDTLDWHTIASTEDLLAIRMQQILRRDKKLVLAMEQQKLVRQRAVDDFNGKHERHLSSGDFLLGTWVLLHETWLDAQMGNKGALRWTGPYIVHRKLRDTTYQLRELDGTVMRGSVAANRLKIFYYREEHQTVRTVEPAEHALHVAAHSSSSSYASLIIGTLNQPLLATPSYPVSVKAGVSVLPDNRSLVYFPAVTPYAFTSHNLHHRFYPAIAELDPMDHNAVQFIRYTASSSFANTHVRENLLEDSNIRDLEVWALDALPLR